MKYSAIYSILVASYIIPQTEPNHIEDKEAFETGQFKKNSDVNRDIQELIDLVPLTEIQKIVENWLVNDRVVCWNLKYFASDEFKKKLWAVENSREFISVCLFIYIICIFILYSWWNLEIIATWQQT